MALNKPSDLQGVGLGWMTETTHIKKPGKVIEVESHSIVGLKALNVQENGTDRKIVQEHLRELRDNKGLPSHAKLSSAKNAGVAARAARDSYQSDFQRLGEVAKSQAALTVKASIYEKIARGELPQDTESFLIDFEKKSYDADIVLPGPDYSVQNGFNEAYERSSMQTDSMRQESERQQWEAEAMKEVETGILSHMKVAPRPSTGVRQRWEYTMSTEEKEFLKEIREETINAREQLSKTVEAQKLANESRRLGIIMKENRKFAFYNSLMELKKNVENNQSNNNDIPDELNLPKSFGKKG